MCIDILGLLKMNPKTSLGFFFSILERLKLSSMIMGYINKVGLCVGSLVNYSMISHEKFPLPCFMTKYLKT